MDGADLGEQLAKFCFAKILGNSCETYAAPERVAI
jgi:hypothetical protein